jgi:YD repeat-containing protein
MIYDPASGRVSTERSWGGAASFAAATVKTSTTYAYIPNGTANAGKVSSRTADGQVTNYAYTARGELMATWGATYPVKYEYDVAGRRSKMWTYRTDPGSNPVSWPAGDVTEWVYHGGTELLQQKKDAAGKGATYTYDAAGRLATRTWARGPSATYQYNTAGELRLTDYK